MSVANATPNTGEIEMKTATRTKKDNQGRVWTFSEGEGSWSHGTHVIGCGGNNAAKWQIWGGPNSGHYEHTTLKEAMQACY